MYTYVVYGIVSTPERGGAKAGGGKSVVSFDLIQIPQQVKILTSNSITHRNSVAMVRNSGRDMSENSAAQRIQSDMSCVCITNWMLLSTPTTSHYIDGARRLDFTRDVNRHFP